MVMQVLMHNMSKFFIAQQLGALPGRVQAVNAVWGCCQEGRKEDILHLLSFSFYLRSANWCQLPR